MNVSALLYNCIINYERGVAYAAIKMGVQMEAGSKVSSTIYYDDSWPYVLNH